MLCTSDIIAHVEFLGCRGERCFESHYFTGMLHLLLAILAYEIQNLESLAFISFSCPLSGVEGVRLVTHALSKPPCSFRAVTWMPSEMVAWCSLFPSLAERLPSVWPPDSRRVSVAEFGTAMGRASGDWVPQLLLPDTWNLMLLRNMRFLLVSSDFWLRLWGREEVLHGIVYFQENKFAVSGLHAGSGEAVESQGVAPEGPQDGGRKGRWARSWEPVLRFRTATARICVSGCVSKPQWPRFTNGTWGIDRA